MRTPAQEHLLRRVSLWILGQALPEAGALRKPARIAMIGVMVASIAGALIALSVAAGMIALYFFLQNEGLSVEGSLGVVAGVGLLTGLLAFFAARGRMDAIPESLENLQMFQQHRPKDIFGELLNMVVGGFMEGISDKKDIAKPANRREEIEDAIEALLAQLEALEEDADELEDEVVLEIDRTAKAKAAPRRKP